MLSPNDSTGKAMLSDGQLPQTMLGQKASPLCLSLRMLPLQRLQQELGARAGLLSSASRAGGTRLALNSGSGLGTQALLVLQHRAGNLTPAARNEVLKHRSQNLLPQERPPACGPPSCDTIRGLLNTCQGLVFVRKACKQHL